MKIWPGAILVAWAFIAGGRAGEKTPPTPDGGMDAGSDTKPGSSTTPDDAEVTANLELLEDMPTLEALDLIQNLATDP